MNGKVIEIYMYLFYLLVLYIDVVVIVWCINFSNILFFFFKNGLLVLEFFGLLGFELFNRRKVVIVIVNWVFFCVISI